MSTYNDGAQLRKTVLGLSTTGQQQDITTDGAATYQLFTVTGGRVLITSLVGVVDTAITVANTINLQSDPTTGDTVVLVTATDLGTTDTAAGTTIGIQRFQADVATTGAVQTKQFTKGWTCELDAGWAVTTGEIESVVTGTNPDGVIDWYATWVPITDGAVLSAATGAAA